MQNFENHRPLNSVGKMAPRKLSFQVLETRRVLSAALNGTTVVDEAAEVGSSEAGSQNETSAVPSAESVDNVMAGNGAIIPEAVDEIIADGDFDPDVNRDRVVSAIDVLHGVNYLNGERLADGTELADLDVNGDGVVSAMDVLDTIKYINQHGSGAPAPSVVEAPKYGVRFNLDGPATVQEGDTITFTMAVENYGKNPLDIELDFTVPLETSLVAEKSDDGWVRFEERFMESALAAKFELQAGESCSRKVTIHIDEDFLESQASDKLSVTGLIHARGDRKGNNTYSTIDYASRFVSVLPA